MVARLLGQGVTLAVEVVPMERHVVRGAEDLYAKAHYLLSLWPEAAVADAMHVFEEYARRPLSTSLQTESPSYLPWGWKVHRPGPARGG